jgi:hypothetical protein
MSPFSFLFSGNDAMLCQTGKRIVRCVVAALLVVGMVAYVSVLYERWRTTLLSRRDETCKELQIFSYQLQTWCTIRGQTVLPGLS